ncbi:MAG: ATP-dependent Clp protease adaptor ClpS [Planctomycetota bacterium]|jgi:hypothetical protein
MVYRKKSGRMETVELVQEHCWQQGLRWRDVHKVSNLLEEIFGDRYEESWVMALELMKTGCITCGIYPRDVAQQKREEAQASIQAWELEGYRCA